MNVEKSSLQIPAEFASTSSIKGQLLAGFQASKEYRHAFIEEAIRSRLAAQVKALRGSMDYKEFANRINKKPAWTYRLEDPNEPAPTIPTLLEVAAAFDIGLDVRFRPFSELLNDFATLTPESLASIPSFEDESRAGLLGAHGKQKRRSQGRRYRRKKKSAA